MSTDYKKNSKSRIEKDLHKVYKSGRFKVYFKDESNIKEFQIEIKGPEQSLYKDSYYRLNFIIPDEYPYKSPSVAFDNKIYHPNIEFCSGSICLNTLNKNWAAVYDLMIIIDVMIPQLLINPNPNDPFNVEASRMFTSDMDLYKFEVSRCLKNHASREAYERKFYKSGFNLEEEMEDHPYFYAKNKNHKPIMKREIEHNVTVKHENKTEPESPFLRMESSVGLFLMEKSRSPPVSRRPLSSGFKKVRSFTSFKKVTESEDSNVLKSSRSKIDLPLSNSKQPHTAEYRYFGLEKKDNNYLFDLYHPVDHNNEQAERMGVTNH